MDEVKQYYRLVKTGFAKLAPYYDLISWPISGIRERAAKLIVSGNPLKVLDIATGTGAQAFAFARQGFNVVGIDLSEAMLTVARRKNKYGNVKFEVGDATALPYPDHNFDVSSVSFALHDMLGSIRKEALQEMVRVTKPGGTLLVVDYALPCNRLGKFLIYHLVSLYEAAYYSEFIHSDLQALLQQAEIAIDQEITVLLGAARILKGHRVVPR